MKRIALPILLLASSVIPRMAGAQTGSAGGTAPAPSLEARVEIAAAKVAAMADALKRLAEAKGCEREEILAKLRRAFDAPPAAPAASRAVTTVETRHSVRPIEETGKDAPPPGRDPAAAERERLLEVIRALKTQVDELKARIAEPEKRGADRPPGAELPRIPFAIGETPPVPKIDGRVVGVSKKMNLLVIDAGEDDGVKIGFEFTIFRGSTYVGRMVVEKVYPKQAAGRVILEKSKGQVLVGDSVSTKAP